MATEKQPISKKARVFLSALALSGALVACRDQDQQVSPLETPRISPTSTPTTEIANPTATVELSPTIPPTTAPTETPEPTPEKEVVHVSGTTIDEGYLRNAFAGIGGGEVVENGQQETTVVEFGQGYVSQSWGEQIDFISLSEDPVASLKYLISLGAYQGAEGVFSPGGQGEEAIFPRLADLSFPRLSLNSVPVEGISREPENQESVSPQGLVIRSGTQMTIIGFLGQLPEEVATDKDISGGGQSDYVLVAFIDYSRVGESNIPRHYLAIIPAESVADPGKNTFSLAGLLEVNGYHYDAQNKEVAIEDSTRDQKTVLELNQIEGKDLLAQVRKEIGIYFVDRIKGELIESPVVPYFDEMPQGWEIGRVEDEKGDVGIVLRGKDGLLGDFREVARANYDQEKEEWYWQESGHLEAEFFMSQEEEEELRRSVTNLSSPVDVESVFGYLEKIKEHHGSDDWMDQSSQYMNYLGVVSSLRGSYYASGGSPETRNSEILEVLAQFREMARENPYFHEEDWGVEGIGGY